MQAERPGGGGGAPSVHIRFPRDLAHFFCQGKFHHCHSGGHKPLSSLTELNLFLILHLGQRWKQLNLFSIFAVGQKIINVFSISSNGGKKCNLGISQ